MTKLKAQRYNRFIDTGEGGILTDCLYIPEMDTTIELNGVIIEQGNHLNPEAVRRLSSGEKNWTSPHYQHFFSNYREFMVEKRDIDSLLMDCALKDDLIRAHAKLEERTVEMTQTIRRDLAAFS